MTDIDFSDLIDELLGEDPPEPERTSLAGSTLVLIESTIELIDLGSEKELSSSEETSSEELSFEGGPALEVPTVVPRAITAMDPELTALRNWLDTLPHSMQKALLMRCSQLYTLALEAQQMVGYS